MKLEPVYLVAPTPEPEGMSRRGVLGSAVVLALGVLGGGAGGYLLGSGGSGSSDSEAPDADAELAVLTRLAQDAPIEELLNSAPYFLFQLARKYGTEELLWKGFDRLAEHVTAGPVDARGRDVALYALDVLEHSESAPAELRRHWVPLLRSRR